VVLCSLAVAVPCAAWFVAGARAAGQEAALLERAPLDAADVEAQRLAQQLTLRLESLRQSESYRPFHDYLNLGEGPGADCSYEIQVASPLAQGPADPLIWTHFQIDEVGQLSVPAFDPGKASSEARPGPEELAILEELECLSAHRLSALDQVDDPATDRLVQSSGGVITVGSFYWHTVTVSDRPALVALREVATSRAVLTQGFVVLADSLTGIFGHGPFPIRVEPGDPTQRGEAALALDATGPWKVSLETAAAQAATQTRARGVTRRFLWTFLGGSFAAVAAGILVVTLVWQTERLSRQRASFAASAAHELRTPLAGLQLYGEMLAEGTGDAAQRVSYARRVAGEAQRLGRVVSNVLGFSSLERGAAALRPRPDDLGSAVRASVSALKTGLESRGAEIDLQIPQEDTRAVFDRDALHQILQNLLDNAEKYSRAAPDRTIRVAVAEQETGPTVDVIDHGPGVEAALQRKLFRPFVRSTNPDAPAGLGIGLVLVRALANAQRARVGFANVPGGGARFSVTFPAA
jgi:signal transduction histidine kinase